MSNPNATMADLANVHVKLLGEIDERDRRALRMFRALNTRLDTQHQTLCDLFAAYNDLARRYEVLMSAIDEYIRHRQGEKGGPPEPPVT